VRAQVLELGLGDVGAKTARHLLHVAQPVPLALDLGLALAQELDLVRVRVRVRVRLGLE